MTATAPVIRIVTRPQANHAALVAGEVPVDGFRLAFERVPVLVSAFRRMVRELAWDACEMAATTYLCAREHGVPFTALPVFLVRGFHHDAIVCHRDGPVGHPGDLAGRRVGVQRGYTVTTGVWARGVLRNEYGLDLDAVRWARSSDEHVTAYRPPANVETLPAGTSLVELLLAGELDAAVGIRAEHPMLRPVIPDPEGAALAALRERGHYPINHLVVVRDDVLAAHPSLAPALYRAFTAAKQAYLRRLAAEGPAPGDATEALHHRMAEATGGDPLPYGLAANRAVLEELLRHARDQHILRRAPELDEVFAPVDR